MPSRRHFLRTSSLAMAALPLGGCVARPLPVRSPYASAIPDAPVDFVVNDVHSLLNETRVAALVRPRSVEELQTAIARARTEGNTVCVAGGRHAMDPQDHGFMYAWSFYDVDGHHWEVFWMDPKAAEEGPQQTGGRS